MDATIRFESNTLGPRLNLLEVSISVFTNVSSYFEKKKKKKKKKGVDERKQSILFDTKLILMYVYF